MTTSAHSKRRVYAGATHAPNTERQEPSSRFCYRDLHPEMYRDKPAPAKRVSYIEPVRQWIIDNGPATVREIASGIGASESAVGNILSKGLPGIAVVGTHLPEKGAPSKKWGMQYEEM